MLLHYMEAWKTILTGVSTPLGVGNNPRVDVRKESGWLWGSIGYEAFQRGPVPHAV